MPDQSRLTHLDAMRGLACLAVCWFHMTNGYGADSWVRRSGSYGWLGVEVFFVISGFIIPYALHRSGYRVSTGWKIFLGKRILRIEPPYLMAVVLALSLANLVTYTGVPGSKTATPIFGASIASSGLSQRICWIPLVESCFLDIGD